MPIWQKDGDEHDFYAQFNGIDTLQHVVVGYLDHQPICWGLKPYDAHAVEIKRMYTFLNIVAWLAPSYCASSSFGPKSWNTTIRCWKPAKATGSHCPLHQKRLCTNCQLWAIWGGKQFMLSEKPRLMYALIKGKYSLFCSPMGYLVIGVFLPSMDCSSGFSRAISIFSTMALPTLPPFFELARGVYIDTGGHDEIVQRWKRMGTMELLLTKPLLLRTIVLGKYLGSLLLILMALLPTVLYVFTISDLGNPELGCRQYLGVLSGACFWLWSDTAMGVLLRRRRKTRLWLSSLDCCCVFGVLWIWRPRALGLTLLIWGSNTISRAFPWGSRH